MDLDQQTVQTVDVERMSRETGISDFSIKQILGLWNPKVMCKAATVEEARVIFYSTSTDGETRQAARARWDALSLEEARQIATLAEAREVYYSAPPNSEAQQVTLVKWRALSREKVARAATVAEALDAFHNAPPDSEAQQAALQKLASFFPKSAA